MRATDGAISIVTAPSAGMITNLPIHNGDSVIAGDTIAAIGDVSHLRVLGAAVLELHRDSTVGVGAPHFAVHPVGVGAVHAQGHVLAGQVVVVAGELGGHREGDLDGVLGEPADRLPRLSSWKEARRRAAASAGTVIRAP